MGTGHRAHFCPPSPPPFLQILLQQLKPEAAAATTITTTTAQLAEGGIRSGLYTRNWGGYLSLLTIKVMAGLFLSKTCRGTK